METNIQTFHLHKIPTTQWFNSAHICLSNWQICQGVKNYCQGLSKCLSGSPKCCGGLRITKSGDHKIQKIAKKIFQKENNFWLKKWKGVNLAQYIGAQSLPHLNLGFASLSKKLKRQDYHYKYVGGLWPDYMISEHAFDFWCIYQLWIKVWEWRGWGFRALSLWADWRPVQSSISWLNSR